MATNIASTELISESIFDSLRTPLLTEGQNDTLDDDRKKKGRSLTSPVVSTSSIDGVGNDLSRAFMGGYPEPVSPFVIMNQNAFDESGTVISPKKGFLRSVNTPNFIEHVPYLRDAQRTKYQEAAIFAQEGIDNDKFASHPNGVYSKIAFTIAHNPFFYITEFVVCCLLLGLAVIEYPALVKIHATDERISVVLHTLLEMVFLSVIAFNILLRFIWMKPKTFLKQRTSLAVLVMIVMFIEAMVVLVKQDSHVRVTRCLRPIFFIDSYIMSGVRRVLRQIVQCIKPIADVMVLLFFMVAIFALAGYYLFADIDPTFFNTYLKSFVSLFITLTTANHPDVFMEAYVRNRASPIFFIIYLFVTLYFFSNVLLAVVYAHFSEVDKEKFRKLYLHKREALRLVYFVLATDGQGINFHDFLLFMLEYKPRIPEFQVMCIFKALQFDPDPQECLCLEEFLQFYEMQNFRWKKVKGDGKTYLWYEGFNTKIQPFFKLMEKIVKSKYFNAVIALIVMCNALYLVIFALVTSYNCAPNGSNDRLVDKNCTKNRFMDTPHEIIGSFIFTTIYIIEIVMRVLAVGPRDYFRKWWNRFDFVVIAVSLIILCVETSSDMSINDVRSYLIIVRPIKLFRLLRLKKRYYEIMNTVFFIGYRLLSVLLLLVIVFYFYAIIGMEAFKGKVYVGCCDRALFGAGSYYRANATSFDSNVYWLNNFDNIYQSYVILYEEMVVNNWFVQMEGFVSETNVATRLFFFAFWITTTICLSVIIAYIVDAFVFRIQVANQMKRCNLHPDVSVCACKTEDRKKVKQIKLASEEISTLKYEMVQLDEHQRRKKCISMSFLVRKTRRVSLELRNVSDSLNYTGKRLRTREDLNLQMFKDDLSVWEEERENKLKRLQSNPQKKQSPTLFVWNNLKRAVLFILE